MKAFGGLSLLSLFSSHMEHRCRNQWSCHFPCFCQFIFCLPRGLFFRHLYICNFNVGYKPLGGDDVHSSSNFTTTDGYWSSFEGFLHLSFCLSSSDNFWSFHCFSLCSIIFSYCLLSYFWDHDSIKPFLISFFFLYTLLYIVPTLL